MVPTFRKVASFGSIIGAFYLISAPAFAASPCDVVDTHLTKQRRTDYAKLIAGNLNAKVRPSKVDVTKFMQAASWTVVYANVPVADPGYFFFETSSGAPKFKDVWGGVADKSEAPAIFAWAMKLGANRAIASCFTDMVAGD